MKELAIKIRHRCNTKENWEKVNPVLDMGEIGIQIPSSDFDAANPHSRWFFKFGDGERCWKDLPWAAAEGDFETDRSLTKQDAAADAKETGDRIRGLEASVEQLLYKKLEIALSFDNTSFSKTLEMTTSFPTQIKFKYTTKNQNSNLSLVYGEKTLWSKNNISPSSGSFTVEDLNLTSQEQEPQFTFTLKGKEIYKGEEKTGEITAKATLKYSNYLLYGFADYDELSDDYLFLNNLEKNFNFPSEEFRKTPDPKGQYFYVCVPAYKKGIPVFVYNGYGTDLFKVKDIEYTNSNGYTTQYILYRPTDKYNSEAPIKLSW